MLLTDATGGAGAVMTGGADGQAAPSGLAQLAGREKGYAEVVRDLNAAALSRQSFDAVQAFGAVAAQDAGGKPAP